MSYLAISSAEHPDCKLRVLCAVGQQNHEDVILSLGGVNKVHDLCNANVNANNDALVNMLNVKCYFYYTPVVIL